MDRKYLESILIQIRLLLEYEMAQRTVDDQIIQPPPPDELEKILQRIEEGD
ncbi:MAG: hypothetical protein LIP16_09120 [Clostridium sp.]|nr:hypothetical protein [Clostridium sp.]